MILNNDEFQRLCKALKQRELAEVLGKHPNNISKFIKNSENIRLSDFLKICNYFKKSPMDFLKEENNG